MILKVSELQTGYHGKAVLDGVDFNLCSGEILAILGPNGCGKTTLLRTVHAMLTPMKGAIQVQNVDLQHLSAEEVARRMGYVAQRGQPSRVAVFDAILLGRKPHLGRRVSPRDLELVDRAIRQIGLEELAMRYVDELSGGELQKVCIARALVQQPSILLLDEPTASLDICNQIEVLQIIRSLVREHRVGAVMTMHDLNLALRFADTFLLLRDGTVAYHGRNEELTAEMIGEVYGIQVEMIWHRKHPVIIPANYCTETKGNDPCR